MAHPFNQFQFIDFAFGNTAALGEGESCHHGYFVSEHAGPRDAQRVAGLVANQDKNVSL
jgi:hypothetical protein